MLSFVFWDYLLTYKYYHFGYYDWDLALYAQAMWNLMHGSFYTSLFGMNFLANHAQYISLVFVPIYAIFTHPLTLIFFKIFSYVLGGYLLYLIGKKHLNAAVGLIFMVLFLTFPANIYALLFEFDFESLSIGLLFLLFYFFQAQKFFPFYLTMFFTALIKENIPPVIIAFGIYALFSKRRDKLRWGLVPIVFGGAIFYLSMFIITPFLRGEFASANVYLGVYAALGDSPRTIVRTLLQDPLKVVKIIARPDNVNFLGELFSPFIFLPLLSPHILFLILPVFLQHLLSSVWTQHTIYFHYAATIVPFVFLSVIQTFKLIQERFRLSIYYIILLLVILFCGFNITSHTGKIVDRISQMADHLDPVRWQMVNKIPPQGEVVATFSFLSHLSQRKSLYALYNVWLGRNYFTGQDFELPQSVSYALIDFDDPWLYQAVSGNPQEAIPRIQDFFFNEHWHVRDAVEGVVLFEKRGKGVKLLEKANNPFTMQEGEHQLVIDNNFRLLKFEIGNDCLNRPAVIPLTFYWKGERDIHSDYIMILSLRDDKQNIDVRTRSIGYNIYPTSGWRKGDYIKEHYRLSLPRLKSGDYFLQIAFVNEDNGQKATLTLPEGSLGESYDLTEIHIRNLTPQ